MFAPCLAEVLRHEGGYSDNPKDPGGATNLGVTLGTWQDWTGKPATKADIKALTLAKVTPLYKARYWDAVKGDDLPPALALCVFDFAVNGGPERAARYLQRMVGAAQDGKIGRQTLLAVQQYVTAHTLALAVRDYQQERRGYYRKLETFPTFGRGWLRRVDEVETAALRMLK